ncbi:MAG: amino acid permease, partial [Actinobacteria bacterium]|nr:amino acid permease [Actinomycetota bacterium]
AGEVRDPEKNVPRATMYGTLATTIVYILGTVAVMGVIPATVLANSTSPFADAAGIMFGGSWDKVIALVALISTFGALNGWILLQGRVPLAAAEDGLFPEQFAKVHGKRNTPVFGLVVSSVLVSGLMLMNYTKGLVSAFTFIILLATLTTLVPYAYSAAAQVQLYFTEPDLFERRRFIRDTAIAALAFAYSIWAITGSGKDIIAKGFILLLAGIPVYVAMKWWQTRQAEREEASLEAPPPAPVAAGTHGGPLVAMKGDRK